MVIVNVRRNRHLKRHIVTLNTDVGVIVKKPDAWAEILNEPYDTVFRPDIEQPFPKLPFSSVTMGVPIFTPCLVYKQPSTFDTTSSAGPDQFYLKMLKWVSIF